MYNLQIKSLWRQSSKYEIDEFIPYVSKNMEINCHICCKQASKSKSVIFMAVDGAKQKMTSTQNNI